jgi:hypothetical protein
MATIELEVRRWSRSKIAIGAGLLALAIVALVAWAWRGPPQMGADEGVFRTVDALFTAVTAKDQKRLADCELRLRGYREAGKIPSAAANELDAIIRKANSGAWLPAAERLYAFMNGQRREGEGDNARPEPDKKSKKRNGAKGTTVNGTNRNRA